MRRSLHALVCLLLLTSFSISQDTPVVQSAPAIAPAPVATPAKPRLKIGVALEGGGALGLAHVQDPRNARTQRLRAPSVTGLRHGRSWRCGRVRPGRHPG